MSRLGEIEEKEQKINSVFEWSIKDFFSLPAEVDSRYESPSFSFANEYWFLRIYPNGRKVDESEGYIDLYLRRETPGPPITVEYTLGMKTVDGKLDPERQNTHSFDRKIGYGQPKWISRSKLLVRKTDLLPSDTLTLVCKLEHTGFKDDSGSSDTETTVCSYCNEDLDDEDFQSHFRECDELPIKCRRCNNDIALKNWHDHKCQMTGLSDVEPSECSYCNKTLDGEGNVQSHFRECEELPIKCRRCDDDIPLKNWHDHKCQMTNTEADTTLGQDYKKMLLDGKNHDLILKVGDKELRAHQDVLRVRSQVFQSMLNHDTTERENGVVDIPDCDPQAMELFLSYVYSGKVDSLDETNMLGLYYIADKYDMRSLKDECRDFIKKSLSHTNVCEVIQLALKHSDKSLLEYATDYFMDNTAEIMVTVEWQLFLKDNLTVGNELMLKSFQKVKDSKN